MPSHSETPLIRKLGIKPATRILIVKAPPSFGLALGPLPSDVELSRDDLDEAVTLDVIILFARSAIEMRATFRKLASKLGPAGALWVAWPKKASGVATDLTDEVVRVAGLGFGLVDNKICSIDATWSAQRFVVRLKDRPKRAGPKKR
jgi:hypothetical protein